MSKIKKGDWVKMSDSLKKALIESDCADHVEEFGDCEGLVEGMTLNFGLGPEVDVRWYPSKLRYGYDPENDLVKIEERI